MRRYSVHHDPFSTWGANVLYILYPCILLLLEVYWAVRRELKSDVATHNVQCQPVGST